MIFKTPAMRLSIVLVVVAVNLLFLANLIGLVPDTSKSRLELRKSLTESLALQFAALADKGDFETIQSTLRVVVERNHDILSAAIRSNDGQLIALAGEHLAYWKTPEDGKSTSTHVHVPVFRKDKKWATVEIRFAPLWKNNLGIGLANSLVGLLAFVILSSFICYFSILKRTMRELDPAAVIPERVQKAFDVLKEGVMILDEKEQIVMANKSFAGIFGKSTSAMIGLKGSELGWLDYQNPKQIRQLPWFDVLQDGQEQKAALLSLTNSRGSKIKLAVHTGKVIDNGGKCRGTLVTFDDITQQEEKNFELSNLVEDLELTQAEIQAKSKELEFLANHDPLTLCLNRRFLDRKLDSLFTKAKADGTHLSCLMIDIDFFKSVNDRYGHATGDQVIKAVADVLKSCTRDTDLVGRYGGEEFCVLLPRLNLESAAQIAERMRQAIEEKSCAGIEITVSVGVASLEFNASKPHELVGQADKALYAAKKGGRNQVATWGKHLNQGAKADSESKNLGQISQTGKSVTTDTDKAQLKRRVQELEGLLEKRTLELEHYEMYDFRTGLPTRSLFEDRIAHEIARADRSNHMVAVLSVTIDTIKRVNETLGYKAAEQLVNACGQRMNDVLRENIDTVAVIEDFDGMSTVSLINQTEFGILLPDIRQVDHVTWVMKRILDSFEKPFRIEGNEIYTSAYFGVSIFPHDGQTSNELYSSASNACSYAEKLVGKDRYLFSSESLNKMAVKQLQIENLLHRAIQNDEFQLYYQPIIEARTGRIAGFEALLRWQSATLGFVSPEDFVPIAEQSGQIDGIGDWVFYNVCQQLRSWMDMGLEVRPIAVNTSGIQLRRQNLANQIHHLLDEFTIDPHLLEIELTETALIRSYDRSLATLKKINEMGLRVSMDDFGTGYSAFSYLRDIPLSGLKIDKSFISDINKDEMAEKLIASIVSIADALGLEVVAEGVEEKHQVDHLTALGCKYLQGYYFSHPIPQSEVAEILQKIPMAQTG